MSISTSTHEHEYIGTPIERESRKLRIRARGRTLSSLEKEIYRKIHNLFFDGTKKAC